MFWYGTWLRRPAGYNNNITILHMKAEPEPLWCAEIVMLLL